MRVISMVAGSEVKVWNWKLCLLPRAKWIWWWWWWWSLSKVVWFGMRWEVPEADRNTIWSHLIRSFALGESENKRSEGGDSLVSLWYCGRSSGADNDDDGHGHGSRRRITWTLPSSVRSGGRVQAGRGICLAYLVKLRASRLESGIWLWFLGYFGVFLHQNPRSPHKSHQVPEINRQCLPEISSDPEQKVTFTALCVSVPSWHRSNENPHTPSKFALCSCGCARELKFCASLRPPNRRTHLQFQWHSSSSWHWNARRSIGSLGSARRRTQPERETWPAFPARNTNIETANGKPINDDVNELLFTWPRELLLPLLPLPPLQPLLLLLPGRQTAHRANNFIHQKATWAFSALTRGGRLAQGHKSNHLEHNKWDHHSMIGPNWRWYNPGAC